ncbi:hypothetical protein D9M68_698330 [compost metagenome]
MNLDDAADEDGMGAVAELAVLLAEDGRLGIAQVGNAAGTGAPVATLEARLALHRAAAQVRQLLLLQAEDVHAEVRPAIQHGVQGRGAVHADQQRRRLGG